MATESLRVVGTSPARLDARDKVTGRTRYTTDLAMRGMVHAKIWRSPLPHARVERIETQDALAAPGVLAVLTAEDVSDCTRIMVLRLKINRCSLSIACATRVNRWRW
jgi:CO/xanthine dehydrogenase Mo-binding subunit